MFYWSLPRSNTSREVQGYLQEWPRGEGEAGETNKTVIYITEQGRKHESCEETLCYDGPMEVFNDMIVFPKDVTFQALVKLLEEKKFVKFFILISGENILFRIVLIDVTNYAY